MGVGLSFGPMLIGVCLNMILYGVRHCLDLRGLALTPHQIVLMQVSLSLTREEGEDLSLSY